MIQVFLYIHTIFSTESRNPWLRKPVRVVLFAHLKKIAEEKGIRVLEVEGGEEHVHLLIQLHPAQNLSQVMRQLRSESEDWLNGTQLIKDDFKWSEELIAYTVSPGSLQQVSLFIQRQEEYHQSKTFDAEIEVFLRSGKENQHD